MSTPDLPHHYEFLESTPFRLADMRRWMRACMFGRRSALVEDAALLVNELATNADQHGGGATELRVSFPSGRDVMRLEVDDTSTTTVPRQRDHSPKALGGRGLVLVDAVSSAWGVINRKGHKTVWAELALG